MWFQHRIAGRARADIGIPDTIDGSFELSDDDTIAAILDDFAAACAESRQIAAEHADLSETFEWMLGPVSLAFVCTHMIQEYARHCGHGDILREQLGIK